MGVNRPNLDAYFQVDGVGGGRNRPNLRFNGCPGVGAGWAGTSAWGWMGMPGTSIQSTISCFSWHHWLPGLLAAAIQ